MPYTTSTRTRAGDSTHGSRITASKAVEPSIVRSGKDDDAENDVLPNLLLDVREGFLGAFRSVFREFGITDQQYRVLSILHRKGDLEISKLARHARIAAPSMTGILDRMTEIGWLTRKVPKGQRWGVVGLTAAGRRLIVQVSPKAVRRFASFEAALGLQQLGQLGELLMQARAVLRDLVESGPQASKAVRKRVSRTNKTSKKPGARAARSGPRPKDRRSSR
jgi:homoprotocatechuate degradation regulator HpaR